MLQAEVTMTTTPLLRSCRMPCLLLTSSLNQTSFSVISLRMAWCWLVMPSWRGEGYGSLSVRTHTHTHTHTDTDTHTLSDTYMYTLSDTHTLSDTYTHTLFFARPYTFLPHFFLPSLFSLLIYTCTIIHVTFPHRQC